MTCADDGCGVCQSQAEGLQYETSYQVNDIKLQVCHLCRNIYYCDNTRELIKFYQLTLTHVDTESHIVKLRVKVMMPSL